MRTATFQFSESGGSLNGPNLFTELPFLQKSLPNHPFTELPPPFSLKTPVFSLKSASPHPLPKNRFGTSVAGQAARKPRVWRHGNAKTGPQEIHRSCCTQSQSNSSLHLLWRPPSDSPGDIDDICACIVMFIDINSVHCKDKWIYKGCL